MKTQKTIRNCLPVFRFECPKQWEALTPTDSAGIRNCDHCKQDVYLCMTDEETIDHAKAGHCIAREAPADDSEFRRVYVGKPVTIAPIERTKEQEHALRSKLREHGIDDSIKNAPISSRRCPQCRYPAPNWRTTCRVCGFEMGRVTDGSAEKL